MIFKDKVVNGINSVTSQSETVLNDLVLPSRQGSEHGLLSVPIYRNETLTLSLYCWSSGNKEVVSEYSHGNGETVVRWAQLSEKKKEELPMSLRRFIDRLSSDS